MAKAGRPSLGKRDLRSCEIRIRVSKRERAALRRACKLEDMDQSQYLRVRAGIEPVPTKKVLPSNGNGRKRSK